MVRRDGHAPGAVKSDVRGLVAKYRAIFGRGSAVLWLARCDLVMGRSWVT